jgi:ribosomal protein S18 acetylase RimI-like enzyme
VLRVDDASYRTIPRIALLVLERSRGLSVDSLEAVARLEAAVIAADGGRLKLEWGVLKSRAVDEVRDVLWRADGELVGFAGLYAFGSATPEVAGMVHPSHRRRGIGSALLDEMVRLCAERGDGRFLLVAPRSSEGARQLATVRGGVLDHSEHALALRGAVADGPSDPSVTLRRATTADVESVQRLLSVAFGHTTMTLELESPSEPTMVAERSGATIGTLRVHKSAEGWGVYGFAVDPAWQGRGIGRDLLRRVCRQANDAGIDRVHLEVSVENDRALGLYTSLGFVHEATEDYFVIAT